MPREITCEHTELVKGSLTVISDEAFKKEKGIERNSPSVSSSKNNNNASGSKCDGRIHCSQMRSCEEATFFLRNCPNVKMDGDNDGIPCENQWC
ncbi:MAG: excalibur calcium-binding domain-containing protein [Candidatus Competibacteraceae bacterium]|nr:excalibur calcium-binding domain-containing protein [Candidatus Competibacteraceae bacterium]